MQPEPEQVTQILDAVGAGDPQAAEKLLPLVYEELRRLAAAKMASEAPGQTLQPTALVHEAWLRLGRVDQPVAWNRRAFLPGRCRSHAAHPGGSRREQRVAQKRGDNERRH